MTKFRNIPIDFNEKMYLKLNPDIVEEFENNPQLHYENFSYNEKRKYKIDVPDDFNGEIYMKLHPDVKEFFPNNPQEHYKNFGYFENREYKVEIPENFDEDMYLKLNPDIKEGYKETGIHHYCNYGYFENRLFIQPKKQFNEYYNFKDKPFKHSKISVILPNYNNEKYLSERLETIYNQSETPFEVIIIDDASDDNSIAIIHSYIKKYPDIASKLIINPINKGSGYYNWVEGIKIASGDLIWIAEADDYCDLNFIETLNICFNNLSVSIAYANTIFTDTEKNPVWSIDKYINEKWNDNFIKSTISLVYEEWSYLNIIPNVSSCIFKKPDNKLLDKILDLINDDKYKLVIDWIFYLLVGKNGSVAYSTETTNFYRQHSKSVSHNIDKERFIFEHSKICEFILENFSINPDNIKKLYNKVLDHFSFDENTLSLMYQYFDIKYLKELHSKNINSFKNILICNYSFSTGGGESFPIFLANEMYNKGVNVFFLSEEKEETQPEIIKLVNKNICIFNDMNNINQIIEDFKITHVNTHHLWCDHDIIQYKCKYKSNINHIITDHGNYRHYYDSNKYVFSYLEDMPTKFIYIADGNRNNFTCLMTNKNITLRKIPICIPDYEINGSEITRESLGIQNSNFVITLVSRPIREKGWDEMIQIVSRLNAINNNNIFLLIVGDLNNTFSINLQEKYKSNENIKFLGFQTQVKKIFSISDIGVLPSYYSFESTPIVLIECLLANKPFITSNIGDIKNMLYGKDGYAGTMIDLNNNCINVETFVNEIQKYINSSHFYNEKVGEIKHVLERLNFTNIVNEYLEFFNE